ncbi:tRNA (5-methylaminomethyl-2-thiouridine)(34)-methyltransferase MnmD [Candidatus Rhodobacter oscarellae]|uniref:tRNA (5-methylaminomethyl-2-thiouridine)(34)-methyltransferase MnmD n=1 Tax=Candidatus Rhodobacter oscarellae TaxID=1675527 RepID=UPI0006712826|nr:tRNA (5-methylaminomethyl-2-thiouridine)(34)-methyltransferase MnmD [Candidatus Rhodobacter lobularis]
MDQRAEIEWRGKVPVSRRFDDPYFSLEDGVAETEHVFLRGNGIPQRFRPGFHIAELGFGTGLNLLVAWRAWIDAGLEGPLRFTSFEAFALSAEDMARALQAYPALAELAAPLVAAWESGQDLRTDTLHLNVVLGDARETLPEWGGQADCWFLDGFAPAQNPELWEPALMAQVARHTAPEGSFATYTAAGAVRRALAEAGFSVERLPGFGRKRHMTAGRLV